MTGDGVRSFSKSLIKNISLKRLDTFWIPIFDDEETVMESINSELSINNDYSSLQTKKEHLLAWNPMKILLNEWNE